MIRLVVIAAIGSELLVGGWVVAQTNEMTGDLRTQQRAADCPTTRRSIATRAAGL
jgi:hypothetical protein